MSADKQNDAIEDQPTIQKLYNQVKMVGDVPIHRDGLFRMGVKIW